MSSPFTHDLTISLIVKNEAKNLAACLDALAPLRKALSCQLIVTDTGSTDGTQDIAKEYADLFLEFEWCDDFAKARNHAIPHATGRWFFYLDADEVCDDSVLEIGRFINSPESHQIGAVTVTVRNYNNPPAEPYFDFQAPRLVNFGKGLRYFKGIVHESFAIHAGSGTLPVLLHHSGYLGANTMEKEDRNTPLLRKAVEEEPLDLRMHVHLIQGASQREEKVACMEQVLEVIGHHPSTKNHFFYPAVLVEMARLAVGGDDSDQLAQARQALFEDPEYAFTSTLPQLEFLGLELEYFLQREHHTLDRDALAEKLMELRGEYESMYLALKKTPDGKYHGMLIYLYETPFHYARLMLYSLEALTRLGQGDKAKQLLAPYNGYQLQDQKMIYPLLAETTSLCMELMDLTKLQEIQAFLKEHGSETDVRDFSRLYQDFLTHHCSTTQSFTHQLTISLIVKNEAHTLEQCLQALTPLRNALSCQLIITDTGSTDGTQDIAKQYADVFLEFEWCDDFAKARNHALPHATGRWFFYLDADEICDLSLMEVATFLSSPESHSIGSATVTQRNYLGEVQRLQDYSDALLARLVNFGKGKRYFEGNIHETIPVHRNSQILPVILHHDGYLLSHAKKKQGRNKALLLELLQNDPYEMDQYIPLLREITDPEEKVFWMEKAFSVVEEMEQGREHFAFPGLLLAKAEFALEQKEPRYMEEVMALLHATPDLQEGRLSVELVGRDLELKIQLSAPVEELLPLFSTYRSLFLQWQAHPDTYFSLVAGFRCDTSLAYEGLALDMVSPLKHTPFLEGGRALLRESVGYQIASRGSYPLLKQTTELCLELEMYDKIQEILGFLKENGALRDFMDVTRCFTGHLKEKGGDLS